MKRTIILSALSVVVACGPGRDQPDNQPPPLQVIEKTSALEAANRNFRNIITGAARSGAFTKDHELLGSMISLGEDGRPLEDEAGEMADDLAARILTIANVEIEEEKRIVLSLKPEVYCASTSSAAGQPDASCVQALTQVPVRLELTSRRENDIDLALTVGSLSVATAQLHQDRIAVELDFGAAMDAAEALANASGEPIEPVEGSIRGRVRVELLANGANDFTLSLSILSPIDVDATVDGETLMIDIGTSQPLASVRIDGNTPKVVFESNVGAIEMKVPLGVVEIDSTECSPDVTECNTEPAELTGTIGVRIEPSSAKMTIDTSNVVKIDRLSSGGTSVTYDGMPLISFSLNGGQPLSAELSSSEQAGTTIAVSPMLDARAMFDLEPLVEQLEEDFPRSMLRDTLQLLLNGAPQPAIRTRSVQRTEIDENGNQVVTEETVLEVVQGRLTLSSSAAGKTVTVDAGMCLDTIEADPEATEEQHPFELLVGATCE